jgi:hypothetical protein
VSYEQFQYMENLLRVLEAGATVTPNEVREALTILIREAIRQDLGNQCS